MPMLEEAKVFLITLFSDCNHFSYKIQSIYHFLLIWPTRMSSPKAVSVRMSRSGTVVDVHAVVTLKNHEIDWEDSLKQIGPQMNFFLTRRHMPAHQSAWVWSQRLHKNCPT